MVGFALERLGDWNCEGYCTPAGIRSPSRILPWIMSTARSEGRRYPRRRFDLQMTILSDLPFEAFVFQVEAINERARLHAVGRHHQDRQTYERSSPLYSDRSDRLGGAYKCPERHIWIMVRDHECRTPNPSRQFILIKMTAGSRRCLYPTRSG